MLFVIVVVKYNIIFLFVSKMNSVVTANGVGIPKQNAFHPYTFNGG